MVFLAEELRERAAEGFKPFAILGSELPFPFRARPSTIMVPGMPDGVIACMPLLDDWGMPSRLTSKSGFPGCHDGYVTDLGAAVAAAARCRHARASGSVRLRPHAHAEGRRRSWRANSTCPARSRWRNTWPAPWAAAPAAWWKCRRRTGRP